MNKIRKIVPVLLVLSVILGCMTSALAGGNYYLVIADAPLRKSPSVDGKKIMTIPEREFFNVSDSDTDERGVTWYYGTYGSKKGWVSSKKLKKYNGSIDPSKKPTAKPTTTPKPINYKAFKDAGFNVRVTAESLNMRKAPSTDYATIRSYPEGTVLYAVKTNGSWYEVKDERTGAKGYMYAKYTEQVTEPVEALIEGDADANFFSLHGVVKAYDAENNTLVVTGDLNAEEYIFTCTEETNFVNANYAAEGAEVIVFYAAADAEARADLTAFVID